MGGHEGEEPEVLEGGHEPRRLAPAGPLRWWPPLASMSAPRRRLLSAAVLAVVAAGAFGYGWLRNRPPQVPPVSVSSDRSTESLPLWSAGRDGRPVAPVTLSVSAALTDPDRRAGTPQVVPVGLAGPGVRQTGAFPAVTLGRAPATIELTAQVSCDDVPIPVPRDAYVVRLRVNDGVRTAESTTPLGASDGQVRQRLTVGCATWLAARDLTVTAVRATVDPVAAHVDFQLDVRNEGSRPALIWTGTPVSQGIRVSDLRAAVPGHGRIDLSVSVFMQTCWSWPEPETPATTAETPLGLLAAVGLDRPLTAEDLPPPQADSGVVLAPDVEAQLRDALVEACGGIASPVLLDSPGRATYDKATRTLSTHIVVDLPPGLVREVRFLPSSSGQTDLWPMFSTTPWLRPDYSGQAGYTVRFSVPGDVPCLRGGPFVALDVEARVDSATGVRDVRFALAAEVFLRRDQDDAACLRQP